MQAPAPIVGDVDVDVMIATDMMMMSMGVPTSMLLESIKLVVIMMLADYFTPLKTVGASSRITLVEAFVNTTLSS